MNWNAIAWLHPYFTVKTSNDSFNKTLFIIILNIKSNKLITIIRSVWSHLKMRQIFISNTNKTFIRNAIFEN